MTTSASLCFHTFYKLAVDKNIQCFSSLCALQTAAHLSLTNLQDRESAFSKVKMTFGGGIPLLAGNLLWLGAPAHRHQS